MYLSRVQIEEKNRQRVKDLNHLGAYHNWVESSFPDEFGSGERTRKLWRIDKLQGRRYLLVLSEKQPDLDKLAYYGVANTAASKSYNILLDRLEVGMKLRFRVTLNPVISISTGKQSGKRGKVMPHVTIEHQAKYLMDRSLKNGFQLNENEFSITERSMEPLKKQKHHPVRLSKVSYEGLLTITDIELFKEALINGIGKKKAYGCGMMTVIPEV